MQNFIRPISFPIWRQHFLDVVRSRDNRAILNKPKIEIRFREETQYMRKIWIAFLMMVPCLFAQGDQKNCKEVSGGVVTNFLNESGTFNGESFKFTTLGTATGDLRGAVGVYIFSITAGQNNSAIAKVHVHWVTEAGDTIFLEDATANAFQVGVFTGVYAVGNDSYTAKIIGGTGRFAGATGKLSHTGVLDTIQGKVVLRYQGEICFAQPEQ